MDQDIESKLRKELIIKYSAALNERQEWRYRISNTILTVSSTIFSIVISLNFVFPHNTYSSILYRVAVLSNLLCILLLFLASLGILHFQDKYVRKVADSTNQPLRHLRNYGGNYATDELKSPKIFLYAQNFSYVLFALMIILYAVFAITK